MGEVAITEYLLQRLKQGGIDHLFGVPGDYVLGLYSKLQNSAVRHIGTTREGTAAFAADGCAQLAQGLEIDRPSLINVPLAPGDASAAMRRLGEHPGCKLAG